VCYEEICNSSDKNMFRIAKYSSCSSCCFVVGIIYIDRFIEQQRLQQRDFRMNSLNVHRLMLSRLVFAPSFLAMFIADTSRIHQHYGCSQVS
jgi:hypothetical protein